MASRHAFHVLMTVLEVLAILALWAHQGILRRKVPPVRGRLLLNRVWQRLRPGSLMQISRSEWYSCAQVAVAGSILLVGLGLLTGLNHPHLPRSWSLSFQHLILMFFTPGLFEELIFRALLLPLPCAWRDLGAQPLPFALPKAAVADSLTACLLDSDSKGNDFTKSTVPTSTGGSVRHVASTFSHASTSSWGSSMATPQGWEAEEAGTADVNSSTSSPRLDPAGESLGSNPRIPCANSSGEEAGEAQGLPRPPITQQVAALAIFVLFHLDLIHSMNPDMAPVFSDPRFLTLAAILGVSCQEATLRTGSLWPGVCMHWLWVWCWISFGLCLPCLHPEVRLQ